MSVDKIDSFWLLSLTEENYFKEIDTRVSDKAVIECQDGIVEISKELLQWSWPYLIFNKEYNVPLTMGHFCDTDAVTTKHLHKDMLKFATKYAHRYLEHAVPYNEISRLGPDVTRMQMNSAIGYLSRYAISLDAEDYHQVLKHPVIAKILRELKQTIDNARTNSERGKAFTKAYGEMQEYMMGDAFRDMPLNGLVHLVLSGTCKMVQLNQGIIGVGFGSDIDSTFFQEPILDSYATGLTSVFSFMANCRSGAKALMYSHDPMRKTEYLHRLVQMISASFNKVYLGDCGSTVTYPVRLTEKRKKGVIGKYFIDPKRGLTELTEDNVNHYVGQTLQVRHPAGCKVPDPTGTCSVCGGAVTNSLGREAKVGWAMSTRNFSATSQAVLSVKHSDLTSVGLATPLNPALEKYLVSSEDGEGIHFDNNREYQVGIFVPNKPKGRELYGTKLHELTHLSSQELEDASPWSYSGFYSAQISRTDGLMEAVELPILAKREEVCLSKEVLKYIHENPGVMRITTHARGRKMYTIDLSMFNNNVPVFTTKFSHADTLKMFEVVDSFVRSSKRTNSNEPAPGKVLKDFHNFGDACLYMFDLLNDKLGINLSVIELSLWPFTVTDPENGDYTPVKGTNNCQFESIDELFNQRSLSAKLGSEEIDKVLTVPAFSARKKRVPSAYDALFRKR